MENDKRIETLNDLKNGDIIRLKEDCEDFLFPGDCFPEIDVVFVAYDNKYDVLTVETEEDGTFEVDGEQFKEVIRRVA